MASILGLGGFSDLRDAVLPLHSVGRVSESGRSPASSRTWRRTRQRFLTGASYLMDRGYAAQ